MIKDLIQNRFSSGAAAGGTKPASPTRIKMMAVPDLKSVISDRGDPKKNSERLRLMLPKVRFPQPYYEEEYERRSPFHINNV